jgi:hypothetical protein
MTLKFRLQLMHDLTKAELALAKTTEAEVPLSAASKIERPIFRLA